MKHEAAAFARALMRHSVEQARAARLAWTGRGEAPAAVHPSLRQQVSVWWAGSEASAQLAVFRARVRLAVRAVRP